MLYILAVRGGMCVLEQPAPAEWLEGQDRRTSLFDTLEMKEMEERVDTSDFIIDQCTTGAPAKKATIFRVVGIPSFADRVYELEGHGRFRMGTVLTSPR